MQFFEIDVAEYLAEIGDVGLAADFYGDVVPPVQRTWPEDEKLVQPFLKQFLIELVSLDHDHEKFRALIQTRLDKGIESPFAEEFFFCSCSGRILIWKNDTDRMYSRRFKR